jgi:hypothetical protein
MKLKGRRLEIVPDIQRESHAVPESIKESDFHGALERGKNDWMAVYVPSKAIFKETAAIIE